MEETRPEPIEVLCVDDEPDSAIMTAMRLEQLDEYFAVETALSAQAGFEYVENNAVDCVVSDYRMPDIDGLTFFEMVREEYPLLPFVLFTGRGSPAVAKDASSKGVTEYLEKSTDDRYEILANQIRSAVRKHRRRAPLYE